MGAHQLGSLHTDQSRIKKMTKTTTEPEDFTMDAYSGSFSDSLANSESLKDTETTISVNWMGGGQIKDPKASWDVSSVYDAAASFPSYVAKTPQKTWYVSELLAIFCMMILGINRNTGPFLPSTRPTVASTCGRPPSACDLWSTMPSSLTLLSSSTILWNTSSS